MRTASRCGAQRRAPVPSVSSRKGRTGLTFTLAFASALRCLFLQSEETSSSGAAGVAGSRFRKRRGAQATRVAPKGPRRASRRCAAGRQHGPATPMTSRRSPGRRAPQRSRAKAEGRGRPRTHERGGNPRRPASRGSPSAACPRASPPGEAPGAAGLSSACIASKLVNDAVASLQILVIPPRITALGALPQRHGCILLKCRVARNTALARGGSARQPSTAWRSGACSALASRLSPAASQRLTCTCMPLTGASR